MKKLLFILLLLPAIACAQTAPFAFPIGVPASGFGGGGGGGSGPYAPTTYTANAILIGNGTGPILATGILGTSTGNALTALNSITAAASTDLTLNAGSGNQNVNLVPTGTGRSFFYAGPSTTFSATAATSDYVAGSTGSSIDFRFVSATGNSVGRIQADTGGGTIAGILSLQSGGGKVLVGTTTDNSNGLLQIASTSSTTGIGFASDLTLYRAAAGTFGTNSAYTVKTAAAVAGTIPMYVNVSGTETLMYVCVSAAQ